VGVDGNLVAAKLRLADTIAAGPMAVADLAREADWSWRALGALLGSDRTEETAFDRVFGEGCFDYLAKHLAESAVLNEGMTGFPTVMAPAVAEAYEFGRFGTVADVGGGHGMLLTTILKRPGADRG
jgi:hypothetical protein